MANSTKKDFLEIVKNDQLESLITISKDENHPLYKNFEYFLMFKNKRNILSTVIINIENDRMPLTLLACKYGSIKIFKWIRQSYPQIFEKDKSIEVELEYSSLNNSFFFLCCYYNQLEILKYISTEINLKGKFTASKILTTALNVSSNFKILDYIWKKFSHVQQKPIFENFRYLVSLAYDIAENPILKLRCTYGLLYLLDKKIIAPESLIQSFFSNLQKSNATENYELTEDDEKYLEQIVGFLKNLCNFSFKLYDVSLDLTNKTGRSLQEVADYLAYKFKDVYLTNDIDMYIVLADFERFKEEFLLKAKCEAQISLSARAIHLGTLTEDVLNLIFKIASDNPEFKIGVTNLHYLRNVPALEIPIPDQTPNDNDFEHSSKKKKLNGSDQEQDI